MADNRAAQRAASTGYGHPPEATRFRKGQSGNPAGRRKGTGARKRCKPHAERLVSLMLEEAYRPIKVNDDGREITMPVARAIFRSLAAAAAKGEMRAQAMFLKLISASEEEAAFYEQMLAEEEARNAAGGASEPELPSCIEIRIVDPADPSNNDQ